MATRFLRYDSDPILRKKCKAVLKVDDKIRQLLDDMLDMILSILVDTFISKISFPMQPGPEIGSISDA